ncbi:MAG TPA: hypothetical protein VIO60_03150 [Rectinemataceae bacterium]
MARMGKWLAVCAGFFLLFAGAQSAFGQDQGTDEELAATIKDLDMEGEGDPTLILTKLAEEFGVELVALQGYFEAGASPGELWLALEISAATSMPLSEAVVLAEGENGHGWGTLAKVLGVKPGSNDFMALKGKIVDRATKLGERVREERQERERKEKEARGEKPASEPKGNNEGKPDKGGKK